MAEKKNTVAVVWDIAQPIADSLGLILWDVRFFKEGPNWYLTIFIDKEGGVNIDDCVNMSKAVEVKIDEVDPIEQSYNLQVSSAGLERKLTRDKHFEQYIGEKIMIRVPHAIDGVREFHGVLNKYENGEITLSQEDGFTITINKKETSWVKADDFPGFD